MSEKKVITITEIKESEYSCSAKNLTLLKIDKKWLTEALKTNHIEVVLKHLAAKVFQGEYYYEKQKVVAFINLIKDMRKTLKKEEYKLNLLIRNLRAFQSEQKKEITLLQKQRLEAIKGLIFIAYNPAYNNMLKNMYKVNIATK